MVTALGVTAVVALYAWLGWLSSRTRQRARRTIQAMEADVAAMDETAARWSVISEAIETRMKEVVSQAGPGSTGNSTPGLLHQGAVIYANQDDALEGLVGSYVDSSTYFRTGWTAHFRADSRLLPIAKSAGSADLVLHGDRPLSIWIGTITDGRDGSESRSDQRSLLIAEILDSWDDDETGTVEETIRRVIYGTQVAGIPSDWLAVVDHTHLSEPSRGPKFASFLSNASENLDKYLTRNGEVLVRQPTSGHLKFSPG